MFIAGALGKAGCAGSGEPAWLHRGLVAGIGLSLALQAWLAFTHGINGDEFHFLSQVHSYLQGSLDVPLQTLHVHLFAPLAALPGNEVDQVIAGRLTMLTFECASLAALYLLARTWSGTAASLMAVLAFATMSLTLVHGASFRTDPLGLAPTMVALALLARAPLQTRSAVAIGLLAAIAFLVTIKVIFFAPAFAGIAAWRIVTSNDRVRMVAAVVVIVAVAAAASISLYLLHQSTLQVASVAKSGEMIASAGSVTILDAGFLPARTALLFVTATSPLHTLLILGSVVALSVRLMTSDSSDRWRTLAILGCLAPMISLLFYRNSFGYFIPTISAPGFVAVAWLVERMKWRPALQSVLAIGMLTTGALSLLFSASRDQSEQRTALTAVHRIFPEPVPYFDGTGMIASFPRQGFFMSKWGMAEYRKRPPIFEDMLRERQIPLLLLNSSAFERALGLGESRNGRLHPTDARVLRENYIPHWGPVWVAGKRVPFEEGVTQITILVPGTYTVEGAPVTLSAREYSPGDTVVLSRGTHRLSGAPGSQAVLKWGDHLPRPSLPPPANLSRGF